MATLERVYPVDELIAALTLSLYIATNYIETLIPYILKLGIIYPLFTLLENYHEFTRTTEKA